MTPTNSHTARSKSLRTDSFAVSEQYDVWVDALNQTYGAWDVPRREINGFFAGVRVAKYGDVLVADTVCDPCSGCRSVRQASGDHNEQVVIQLTREGQECFQVRGENYNLGPGDIMIWDSTKAMSFDVSSRLHKTSLILPLRRLRDWLPKTWHTAAGRISARSPDAILLTAFIESLTNRSVESAAIKGEHLSEAAIALLAGSRDNSITEHEPSARHIRLKTIQDYVRANLGNVDLTLDQMAADNAVSKRYLHWLFRPTGETVSRYIQRLRLEKCRMDLVNPAMKNKAIADIAYSWGFSDPMHFSRTFKNHFGMCPSDLRNNRNGQTC